MPNCRWQEQIPEAVGSWRKMQGEGWSRGLVKRVSRDFIRKYFLSWLTGRQLEDKTGGEQLQPVTVNVKLSYKGLMMRQRGRGKIKAGSYFWGSKAGEDGSLQRVWVSGIRVNTGRTKRWHRVGTKFSSRLEGVEENHLFLCFWWRKRKKNIEGEGSWAGSVFCPGPSENVGRDKESIFRQAFES